MTNTILNPLFNYKGKINYREFRVGMIILILLMGTHLSIIFNTAINQITLG